MKYLIICCFLFSGKLLFSQHIIQTDRPNQTESPFIIPVHQLQWETGSVYTFNDQSTKWIINNSLFRYAVLPKFEIRMLVNVIRDIPVSSFLSAKNGLSDLEVGFKYNFLSGPLQFSLLSHALFPSGNAHFTSGSFGVNSKICISHAVTNWMSAGYNLAYIYGAKYDDEFYATCLASFTLTDRLGYYIEWFGNTLTFDRVYSNMGTGFTWLYKNHVQLDLSYGSSLYSTENFISFGCSVLSIN